MHDPREVLAGKGAAVGGVIPRGEAAVTKVPLPQSGRHSRIMRGGKSPVAYSTVGVFVPCTPSLPARNSP